MIRFFRVAFAAIQRMIYTRQIADMTLQRDVLLEQIHLSQVLSEFVPLASRQPHLDSIDDALEHVHEIEQQIKAVTRKLPKG